jgi:uncharacterized protein YdhG (YjbR/CyaY superfamily)
MHPTRTPVKSAPKAVDTSKVFSDEERAAMQEAARERKAAGGRDPAAERAEGEREVLAKIAALPEPDRSMGERIHALITATVPTLVPRTYYGMPAYAREGKVICFFKPASKFKVRYATLGFQPDARLDDGAMWPVEFALMQLTADAEARIASLVERAAS